MQKFSPENLLHVTSAEITAYTEAFKHLYLVGNLQKPVPHPYVVDQRLEFVLCNYESGDQGIRHWHRELTEYTFVIQGRLSYMDIVSEQVYDLESGDFFVIPAGQCMSLTIDRPTTALTIKVPSILDKVYCTQCSRVCKARLGNVQIEYQEVS